MPRSGGKMPWGWIAIAYVAGSLFPFTRFIGGGLSLGSSAPTQRAGRRG